MEIPSALTFNPIEIKQPGSQKQQISGFLTSCLNTNNCEDTGRVIINPNWLQGVDS